MVGSFALGLPDSGQAVVEEVPISRIDVMLYKAPHILLALTFGGVIVGLPVAVGGYFFTFNTVCRYRNQIREKLAQQKAKRLERRENKRRRKRGKKKNKIKRRRKGSR